MKKGEIPVEISNGSRHSVWKASENMGCLLRWCIFSLFCLFSSFGCTLWHVVLPPRQIFWFMFMHKISTRVFCVNVKHPWCADNWSWHPNDEQLRHVDIYILATKIICSLSTLNVLMNKNMDDWIVRVNVVLNRTVVDSDGRFDNLCGSYLQSQSELYHVSWWY